MVMILLLKRIQTDKNRNETFMQVKYLESDTLDATMNTSQLDEGK